MRAAIHFASARPRPEPLRTVEALLPLYDKYGVDLVLQGHDHLYARSQKLAGGKVVAADDSGTVLHDFRQWPQDVMKSTIILNP